MAGAIFIVDQIPGAGAGAAGVPRDDLHADKALQVRPSSPSGNSSYFWELLDLPPGSTAVISDPAAQMPTITAIGLAGSPRLQLTTNDGGSGNVTVQTLRVLSNATGLAASKRGWGFPGFGESDAENRFDVGGGDFNERGWAPALETILHDVEDNAFIVNDSMAFSFPGPVQAAPMLIGTTRPLVAQIRFSPTAWRHVASNIQLQLAVRIFHSTSDHTSDVKLFKLTSPAVQIGATQTVNGLGEKSITLDFTDFTGAGFVNGDAVYELRVATSFQTSDPVDLGTNAGAYEAPVLLSRLLFRNKV
jgi:hypothetical protein